MALVRLFLYDSLRSFLAEPQKKKIFPVAAEAVWRTQERRRYKITGKSSWNTKKLMGGWKNVGYCFIFICDVIYIWNWFIVCAFRLRRLLAASFLVLCHAVSILISWADLRHWKSAWKSCCRSLEFPAVDQKPGCSLVEAIVSVGMFQTSEL